MAGQGGDLVSIRLNGKLGLLSSTSPKCSIFRVPKELSSANPEAYEPMLVSIGPYHHGRKHLEFMESYKVRCLEGLLKRVVENDLTTYVTAMRALEGEARKCYEEPTSLDSDDFVEMMLLDGCFIIELIRKMRSAGPRDDDPIINVSWMRSRLKRDMLLIENQLPLFVHRKLFSMTQKQNQETNFQQMISWYFDSVLPGPRCKGNVHAIGNHLLGFVHNNLLPSPARTITSGHMQRRKPWKFIRCATRLKEAGIKFRKVEGNGCSMFDIGFEKGIMEIPTIRVDDDTESFFRNLIAYEQFSNCSYPNLVFDYITFMAYLINSPSDVELLRHRGIIESWIGDDAAVVALFNSLGKSVILSSANFCYAELFNRVNSHCSRRGNRWTASLRHNYFNSPWAIISILVGLLLLLLTAAQTCYSALSYHRRH